MKDAFVYALLDPRKLGPFRYGRWVFSHEPFYIGKGHSGRAEYHHKYDISYSDTYKTRKIKKILKETGRDPIIVYKRRKLTDKEALQIEVNLIEIIGRGDKGPLTNLTDGGEGCVGRTFYHTENTKRKIGSSNARAYAAKSQKQKVKETKIRALALKRRFSLMTESERKKFSDKHHRIYHSLTSKVKREISKKLSESTSTWWKRASKEQIARRIVKSNPGKGKKIRYQGKYHYFIELHRKLKSNVPYATAYARVFKYGWKIQDAFH